MYFFMSTPLQVKCVYQGFLFKVNIVFKSKSLGRHPFRKACVAVVPIIDFVKEQTGLKVTPNLTIKIFFKSNVFKYVNENFSNS